MATRLNAAFTLALAVFALVSAGSDSYAIFIELTAPSVAMPKDYPESDYKEIRAVLERKDCRFLGGNALNSFTTLRYGGDTIALNKFVDSLSRCSNATVHVSFLHPAPGAPKCDWMVTHEPRPTMKFVVRINLDSKNVKLDDLSLPPVKAEKNTSTRK